MNFFFISGNIDNAFDLVLRSREYHDLESHGSADVKNSKHIGAEAPEVEKSIAPGEVSRSSENAEDLIQDANASE